MSKSFESVVRNCLRKDPEDRYANASELQRDLEALRTGHPTGIPAAPTGVERPSRRLAAAAGLGAAAILALAVAADVGGVRSRLFGGAAGRRIDSLAVLPLANLSKDPEQEYFADGMTEAVIAELSRLKALKVISRTSVMRYKNTSQSLPEIAKALGVKGVVEGSVLRDGKAVRITVQLIDAADRHLWAESYTREDHSILSLQSEVAAAIAREVRVAVSPEEADRLVAARPVDPEAHRLVLLGANALAEGLTQRAGIEKATELFRKAVAADPQFALAHTRLAGALEWSGFAGYRPTLEACAEARVEAEKAIALDVRQGEALALMSRMRRTCEFDWAGAERDIRRALEQSPGSAAVHMEAAYLWSVLGRHEEAIREVHVAEELDPLTEETAVFVAHKLFFARRFGDAERQLGQILARSPDSVVAKWMLANVLAASGRREEAIQVFLSRKVPDPKANFALGLTYGLAGRKDEARKVLAGLLEKSKSGFLPPTQIALVYASLGEKEAAWAWLKQSWDDRAMLVNGMGVDPLFDAFRSDPRFADLLRKMNLPDAR